MAGSPSSPAIGKTHGKQSFVRRYLDPTDRLGEVFFGLIMVLTFTLCAGLVVQEGRDATTQILLGILGCNVAWGLIGGGMYILGCLFDRSRKTRLLESSQQVGEEEEAMRKVEAMLEDGLEPFTSAEERTQIYWKVLRRLEHVSIERTRLKQEDVYSAIAQGSGILHPGMSCPPIASGSPASWSPPQSLTNCLRSGSNTRSRSRRATGICRCEGVLLKK